MSPKSTHSWELAGPIITEFNHFNVRDYLHVTYRFAKYRAFVSQRNDTDTI